MHSGLTNEALFKMADQYTAGVDDGAIEANENDSRKRPLDQSGESRQPFKRSNLGGKFYNNSNCGRAYEGAIRSFNVAWHAVA